MAQTQEGKKTFYIVLIIILLFLNGFFAYKHWTTKKELVKTTAQRDELDSLYTIAKDSMTANGERINSLQGKNAELDSLMSARQKELEAAVAQLEKLKKDGNYSRSQLEDARNRVKTLQEENKRFLGQIDSLNTKVQFLTKERDSLNTGLQVQQAQNKQLLSEKEILAKKAELASLLKPENVDFKGIFMKSSGAPKLSTKAKKTTALSLCFDIPENKVADSGQKTFFIRILNPQGATISVESSGSGSFTDESGQLLQYTMTAQFQYDKARMPGFCAPTWTQTQAFGSGEYTAIIYQDGHELVSQKMTLK